MTQVLVMGRVVLRRFPQDYSSMGGLPSGSKLPVDGQARVIDVVRTITRR